MVRAPCCEKMGLKRGPWTPEEDKILVSHVEKNGHENWRALPKQAGNYSQNPFSACLSLHRHISTIYNQMKKNNKELEVS
jgi:hypothetical protein